MDAVGGVVENLDLGEIQRTRYPLRVALGSLEELKASIIQRGLLHPVIVRPVADGYEIVAGNRRLEACRQLGMRRLPCHVLELNEREAFEVSLIENLQHETLDPIEEAQAFRSYIHRFGHGAASELAKKIGKSPTYVSRRISLLSPYGDEVGRLLRRRKIPVSVATELLSLDELTRNEVIRNANGERITRRQVRKIVKESRMVPEVFELPSARLREEAVLYSTDRAFDRCVVSLRVCMNRLDDVLEYLGEDNWLANQTISHYRGVLHAQIDGILKLKRRTVRYQREVLPS